MHNGRKDTLRQEGVGEGVKDAGGLQGGNEGSREETE